MDLSLDDIIKQKKGSTAPSKKFNIQKKDVQLRKTYNKPVFKETQRIKDARFKIIENNRSKIRDARDKLAEITRASGDARQRLIQKQLNGGGGVAIKNGTNKSHRNGYETRNGRSNVAPITRKLYTAGLRTKGAQYRSGGGGGGGISTAPARMPKAIEIPRGYVDYDNMERMEEEEYAVATRLSRTVKNDISDYDGYGGSNAEPPTMQRLNSWSSSEHYDPFDVYEVPHGRHERNMSPELPPPPPKGILRPSARQHSPELYQRRYIPETLSHLSYEMRSRLERAPDPHASMGIFSNPLKTSSSSQHSSSSGYRIVVSNLHTSVTQSDIKELFEDIGDLYDSRIVRPGVAEVIYTSLADAEKAVDTYHNRQLDGQPMKCLLVNPRASNKPTAPAIKSSSASSRLTAGKTPLEIDIDALHKVLFRRH